MKMSEEKKSLDEKIASMAGAEDVLERTKIIRNANNNVILEYTNYLRELDKLTEDIIERSKNTLITPFSEWPFYAATSFASAITGSTAESISLGGTVAAIMTISYTVASLLIDNKKIKQDIKELDGLLDKYEDIDTRFMEFIEKDEKAIQTLLNYLNTERDVVELQRKIGEKGIKIEKNLKKKCKNEFSEIIKKIGSKTYDLAEKEFVLRGEFEKYQDKIISEINELRSEIFKNQASLTRQEILIAELRNQYHVLYNNDAILRKMIDSKKDNVKKQEKNQDNDNQNKSIEMDVAEIERKVDESMNRFRKEYEERLSKMEKNIDKIETDSDELKEKQKDLEASYSIVRLDIDRIESIFNFEAAWFKGIRDFADTKKITIANFMNDLDTTRDQYQELRYETIKLYGKSHFSPIKAGINYMESGRSEEFSVSKDRRFENEHLVVYKLPNQNYKSIDHFYFELGKFIKDIKMEDASRLIIFDLRDCTEAKFSESEFVQNYETQSNFSNISSNPSKVHEMLDQNGIKKNKTTESLLQLMGFEYLRRLSISGIMMINSPKGNYDNSNIDEAVYDSNLTEAIKKGLIYVNDSFKEWAKYVESNNDIIRSSINEIIDNETESAKEAEEIKNSFRRIEEEFKKLYEKLNYVPSN